MIMLHMANEFLNVLAEEFLFLNIDYLISFYHLDYTYSSLEFLKMPSLLLASDEGCKIMAKCSSHSN